MDQTAVQQNEKQLEQFVSQADKKFVPQVGIMALALLTEQMEPDQYKQFLSDCIDNAADLHKAKLLGLKNVAGSPSAVPEGSEEDEETGDSTNG
jgi:hypothetical protein